MLISPGFGTIAYLVYQSKASADTTQNTQIAVYHVDGLNTLGLSPDAYLATALTAPGIPAYGAASPTYADMYAIGFEVVPRSNFQALVIVQYVQYKFNGSVYCFEGDSQLNQDQTNYAVNAPNVPLLVRYWPDPVNIGKPAAAANLQWPPQNATVNVFKPREVLNISWFYTLNLDPVTMMDDTLETLKAAVGMTNALTWQGGAPNSWICADVKNTRVGMAAQQMITAQFIYRPETWLAWAVWVDPKTGRAPARAHKNPNDPGQKLPNVGSNGWAGLKVYQQSDFEGIFGIP